MRSCSTAGRLSVTARCSSAGIEFCMDRLFKADPEPEPRPWQALRGWSDHEQIHRLEAALGEPLGDDAAMALSGVALEAEEADRLLAGKLGQLFELRLRRAGCELLAEDPMHPLGVAGTGGFTAGFGRAEVNEVPVADLCFGEVAAQLVLREPLLARERDRAHVGDGRNAGVAEGREKAVHIRALVADGEEGPLSPRRHGAV